MLTQYELDILMRRIQLHGYADLYYVAHMVEPREGLLDEHIYKSSSKFKVVKLKLMGVYNAFFEYLNFLDNPDEYHTEEEESYYDRFTMYKNLYTVKNSDTIGPFQKDINPRSPSIVYGYRRKIIDTSNNTEIEINDPSPVKPVYTNFLVYADLTAYNLILALQEGRLDWKYKRLNPPAESDGIEYNYVTSDWYILDIANFPRTEKPLIKTKELNAYFYSLNDAFNYIEQLEA